MIKTGQAAFEYMLIVGLMLFPILFIVVYAYSGLTEQVNVFMVNSALEKLEAAVDDVYSQGINGYRYVVITLPSGYSPQESFFGSPNGLGKTLQITYKSSSAFRNVLGYVYGEIQGFPGTYLYKVYKTSNNTVRITYSSDINRYLITYLTMDNHTNDVSGNGNNGTIYGLVNCSQKLLGRINTGCRIITGGIRLNNINLTKASSVCSWIYLHENKEGMLFGREVITNGKSFMIYYNASTGKIGCYYSGASDYWQAYKQSDSVILNDTWYHVCCVYDQSNIRLYVNGSEEGNTIGNVPAELYNSASVMTIGYLLDGSQNIYLNATVDEFRIYSRALSRYEVEELYDLGH